MNEIAIQYNFYRNDGGEESFTFLLDSNEITLIGTESPPLPSWTELSFHQCPHCPLLPESCSHCPAALHLAPIVKKFEGLLSHDELLVEVITDERKISQRTTAQRAIGSMMGLVISTSGCPYTTFFRPMARFHLPLASEEETIHRAASMYFLAQFFRHKHGEKIDIELKGLVEIYKNIEILNRALAQRLRDATRTDSSINAVIFLDMYAKAMPYIIKEALDELEYLYKPYLKI
jgi:hypothetical protein